MEYEIIIEESDVINGVLYCTSGKTISDYPYEYQLDTYNIAQGATTIDINTF